VLDHAREHGADPDRIALAGESAGANLVTALTVAATHPRQEPFARAIYDRAPPIRAVLPIYGILDLHHLHRFTGNPRLKPWLARAIVGAGAAYVGRPIREGAARAPLASPLRILAEPAGEGVRPLPPFFVAAGTADPLLDDSRRLCRAIEARGGVCELAIYPGEIHGFNAMLWRPAARAKWRAVGNFLRKHVG
jgi:acetyl esterase